MDKQPLLKRGVNRETAEAFEMVLNAVWRRMRGAFGNDSDRKNIYDSCDWPEEPTIDIFAKYWERDPIAARVVELYPKEVFRHKLSIYEDSNPEVSTEFEVALKLIDVALQGGSTYIAINNTQPLQNIMREAYIQLGIGGYAITVIGFNDGLPLHEPLEGTIEENSLPMEYNEESKSWNALQEEPKKHPQHTYVHNAKAEPLQVTYMQVYNAFEAQIVQIETNRTSSRYGKPIMYNVTMRSEYGYENIRSERVHWTRVVHHAESKRAISRMLPVLNNIVNIQRMSGASAVGYWRNGMQGVSVETQPNFAGDPRVNVEGVKQQLEDYFEDFQRQIVSSGFTIKTIAAAIMDPEKFIEVQKLLICIKMECPVRIFNGSERGELASGQDADLWENRIMGIANQEATPTVVQPILDRLIEVQVLPVPELGYTAEWEANERSETVSADIASKRTTTMSTYVNGGVNQLMGEKDFLTREMGYSDEDADAILANIATVSDLYEEGDPYATEE
jgi:hypothetical protein